MEKHTSSKILLSHQFCEYFKIHFEKRYNIFFKKYFLKDLNHLGIEFNNVREVDIKFLNKTQDKFLNTQNK